MTNITTHTAGRLTAAVAIALGVVAVAGRAVSQDDKMAAAPATTQPAAAAKTVDNPQYGMWKKFKPGSSSTMAGDVTSPMGKAHMEVTQTLKAVADDAVTLEIATKMSVMGQSRDLPPQTTKVEAKEVKEESKETGKADVEAAGKTYKCTVYEQPAKTGADADADPTAPKAKFYTSDEVPGGVVKAELPGPGGATMTMTLKSTDVK